MGTEKFFAFNESGELKRLKGRILRFLNSEDPDNDDKAAIRSSISVPASAEGLTPTNNLSDVSDPATARDNIAVPSDDELAESIALKLSAPALYFDGSNDYMEVADSDLLSFTDGSNDLPFSVSAWIKMGDATSFAIAGKYGTTSGAREWVFQVNASDKLTLLIRDTASASTQINSDAALTGYEGQWVHVACTYGGAGPSAASGAAFTANMSGGNAALYVNGKPVASTAVNDAAYVGMSNTAQAVWIGRLSTSYAKGHIKDVRIHNYELTAAEVEKDMRDGDHFKNEWGGVVGGVYTSDFSAGVDGWFATRATLAGNVDAIGGQDDNLRLTISADNNNHSAGILDILTTGKLFSVSLSYFIPSTNSHVDGLKVSAYSSGAFDVFINESSPTLDQWNTVSGELLVTNNDIFLLPTDGGSVTINDAGGDDVIYFRNVTITELGVLADFRSEDFNASSGKWLDRSSNNFVGVNNGATLVGARRHISAATLNLTGLPTSSAGLSSGEVWNNSGVLTIVT